MQVTPRRLNKPYGTWVDRAIFKFNSLKITGRPTSHMFEIIFWNSCHIHLTRSNFVHSTPQSEKPCYCKFVFIFYVTHFPLFHVKNFISGDTKTAMRSHMQPM